MSSGDYSELYNTNLSLPAANQSGASLPGVKGKKKLSTHPLTPDTTQKLLTYPQVEQATRIAASPLGQLAMELDRLASEDTYIAKYAQQLSSWAADVIVKLRDRDK
jgi:hypothetical protein